MKHTWRYPAILLMSFFVSCHQGAADFDYNGEAYASHNESIPRHIIPGRIQCEYYDIGGEGVAFHDTDVANNGSGRLNKGSRYVDVFRMNESVDISYTKFHDSIDNSSYNSVRPAESQLYIGWTEPGEWVNFTVDVEKTAVYKVGIMYTCNGPGQISFLVNNKDKTGIIHVPSTSNPSDPVPWRHWHHWDYKEQIAEISLDKGIQVITLRIVKNGQMNYDFLSFTE